MVWLQGLVVRCLLPRRVVQGREQQGQGQQLGQGVVLLLLGAVHLGHLLRAVRLGHLLRVVRLGLLLRAVHLGHLLRAVHL